MLRRALAFVPLIALLFAGCASRVVSYRSSPVLPDQFPEVRAEHMRVNPMVRLGLVTDVLPDSGLVSVDYTQVGDFVVGDTVSIVDSNDHLIANGTVTEVVGQKLTVQYVPATHTRGPAIGDLLLHFQ
jgi:hypothetical protein